MTGKYLFSKAFVNLTSSTWLGFDCEISGGQLSDLNWDEDARVVDDV